MGVLSFTSFCWEQACAFTLKISFPAGHLRSHSQFSCWAHAFTSFFRAPDDIMRASIASYLFSSTLEFNRVHMTLLIETCLRVFCQLSLQGLVLRGSTYLDLELSVGQVSVGGIPGRSDWCTVSLHLLSLWLYGP